MSESPLVRPAFDDVPPARRRNLAAVAGKDTAPELLVRRLLHGMGYRFRVHRRDLPGTPDIVLPARRKIVEVRGCFWHRHSNPACRNAVSPKVRADWWAAKLTRNVERDERNLTALGDAGWSVLVLWECEVKDLAGLAARLRSFLG
ncbi:MAG: DNA mismatch endonuclease Vsr [Acetobacteraceae bacterium]